jgi:hypothetical protein
MKRWMLVPVPDLLTPTRHSTATATGSIRVSCALSAPTSRARNGGWSNNPTEGGAARVSTGAINER